MMSVRTILTISSYEGKVLSRNWFFRIVALAGVAFLTLFNLVLFSELDTPAWRGLANGWILPYAGLLLISIPQAAAVIFLATGLVKKDKKLDTNEVFFVRPITNLDYVMGKALALFKLFFLLNLVFLCIPLIVGLTNPFATVNPMAFVIYPLLTSVPGIVFTTGISFLLVTVIRNQPISIVLLIGLAGVQLIYYFDKFSNILDFTSFRIPMLASEISGFVDIEFALWQRTFYFVSGIAFLFVTAFLLERLSGSKASHRATALAGFALLLLSSLIMINLWHKRQAPIELRQAMITTDGKWANVSNADITEHAITLEWKGNEIVSTSDMVVNNNTGQRLDTIYFTLNPELVVDAVFINDASVEFARDWQIVSVSKDIDVEPGQQISVRIQYHGRIGESAAHIEVDQTRYENAIDFLIFSLPKKYAFLEDDYVLLTKDVLWYPDTDVGCYLVAAAKKRNSFTQFALSVKAPGGKIPISQGEVTVNGDIYEFKPEYPLPQISLVIGDYVKKEITVDGITYAVFHYPKNDYFARQLDQLADTLSYLITDVVDEYEDIQKLSYPFKRLQFVEVPHPFTAYNKVYESYQAFLQPETVFWPEEGGTIPQFDFRRQLREMNRQAAKTNQVLTDKQKQANVFNDLIRKVFTKQTGTTWVNEGNDFDRADYSLFPNYYDFNTGVASNDWLLLNRGIAAHIKTDKQIQNDYSRNMNGISFTEECNTLMRTSPITSILTDAEFSKINKSVSLKSEYLFAYLGQIIGENNLKSFLFEWVNTHQHQLTSYADLRKAMFAKFDVDIDPIIRNVYSSTSQPAFEILDVQKYEVMDGDRKRYQVLIKAKNSGDSDGVLEIRFKNKSEQNNDDFNYPRVEEITQETPGQLTVIRQGDTKLLGFLLDEMPNDVTINTMISKNIPSVINVSLQTISKREGVVPFQGERVVDRESPLDQYELIVDNEDRGFSHFSPIKPTILKAWLDRRNAVDHKYHGDWSGSYSRWLATTGSDFYGRVIRSAYFTRSGNGDKIATWTPTFEEEGHYDVYVYMRGKNQLEFVGHDGAGKQFEYHYIIRNGDGIDHINYNITNAQPGWNYLGSYYFNKTGGSMSLTDECELRTVYADAVRFVKQ